MGNSMKNGLTYNSALINRLHSVLQSTSLKGSSLKIIGPIANFFSMMIQSKNWSSFRDDAIINLLDTRSAPGPI